MHATLDGVDDIDSRLEPGNETGHAFRTILEIGVHEDDDIAGCTVEACSDRRVLSKIAAEANTLDPRVGQRELLEHRPGSVRTAIVDEQKLGIADSPRRGLRPSAARAPQALGISIHRNDNGNQRRRHSPYPPTIAIVCSIMKSCWLSPSLKCRCDGQPDEARRHAVGHSERARGAAKAQAGRRGMKRYVVEWRIYSHGTEARQPALTGRSRRCQQIENVAVMLAIRRAIGSTAEAPVFGVLQRFVIAPPERQASADGLFGILQLGVQESGRQFARQVREPPTSTQLYLEISAPL